MRSSPLLLFPTLLLLSPALQAFQGNPGPSVVRSRRVADRGEAQSQPTTVAPPTFRVLPLPTGPSQEPRNDDQDADGAAVYEPPGSPLDLDFVVSSGELRLERKVLFVKGRGEVDFSFECTYRSRLGYEGPIGFGWTFTYDEALARQPNGDLLRHDGRGHVDRWVGLGNGAYQAPAGFFGTLIDLLGGGFVLRETNGFEHFYRADGRLERLEDRHGNTLVFSYSPGGELASAQDPFGRVYTFVFADLGGGRRRLTGVADFAGREVVFTYDANGDLASIRSPIVVGTSIGNDFPQGRSEAYTYLYGQADPQLDHDLVTLTRPNEVAAAGPPVLVVSYGSSGLERDRVLSATIGGTNASGVPSGGVVAFSYTAQNQGLPPGHLDQSRLTVEVTDRSSNVQQLDVNELEHLIRLRHLTRGLRAGEPAHFESVFEFTPDGQRTREIRPLGNEVLCVYGSGPRAAQKNLLEVRRVADAARGGGEDLVTTMSYEPVYQQLWTVTDPRGNASAFTPPVGVASAARYTTRHTFDYQEGSGPIPDAVLYGIDTSGIPRGLGDQNGDGRTDQVAGNVVVTNDPSVTLLAGSNEAARLGSTTQVVRTDTQWNDFGQVTATIDPEGNLSTRSYYPENDPDGDGTPVPGQSSTTPGGYLQTTVVDDVPAPARRTSTAPPAALTTVLSYDPLGNVVATRNPRGVVTAFEVNALGEVVVITRGADVSQATASGQLITGESAFGYQTRFYRDPNGLVVATETENRAAVSTTTGVGDWVERGMVHDIEGREVAASVEVDATTTLTTQRRYDGNGLQVRITYPRGNSDTSSYDERNLPFQVTKGFGSPEAGVFQVDYDLNGNRQVLTDAEDNDGVGGPEQTVLGYDGFDRQVSRTDAIGRNLTQTLDPAGKVVRTQAFGHPAGNPAGANVLHSDVSSSYDELGRRYQTNTLAFVPQGYVLVRAQPPPLAGDGVQTDTQEWDALGRPVFCVEDDGDTHATTFDGAGRPIEQRDPVGNRQLVGYDLGSNPIRVESIEASPAGLLPDTSFVSFYVWDQLDRLVRATDNSGLTTRLGYDSRDNTTVSTDGVGPLLASDPLGLFPEAGQSGQVNGAGNQSTQYFDGLDRLVRREQMLTTTGQGGGPLDTTNPFNPDGRIGLTNTWDENSNLVGITDDNGSASTFVFDDRGRRAAQTNADGQAYAFVHDRDDNLIQVTDPNGSVVNVAYDGGNRCVQTSVQRGPGVVGTTLQTFDYAGTFGPPRPTASDDHNTRPDGSSYPAPLGKVFDSRGLLLEEKQSWLNVTVSNRFAGDGTREGMDYPGTGASRKLAFTHDGGNRLEVITDTTATPFQVATFDYVGPGRREPGRTFGAEPTNDPAPLGVVFDSHGLLLEEKQSWLNFMVSNRFVGEGKRESVDHPWTSTWQAPAITHDGSNRLEVTSGATTLPFQVVTFDYQGPGSRELRRAFGNGSDETRTWDDSKRLVSSTHTVPGGAVLAQSSYTHNRAGVITSETRSSSSAFSYPPGTDTFVCDSAYRLTGSQLRETGGPVLPRYNNASFTLDGVGSRREEARNDPSPALPNFRNDYSVNGMNEYTRIDTSVSGVPVGSTTLLYDNNGNLIDDGTLTYHWDYLNRLVQVRKKASGALVQQNYYYADGRREEKWVMDAAGTAIEASAVFLYDGQRCIEEADSTGTNGPRRSYVWGPQGLDDLVAYRDNSIFPSTLSHFYVHRDGRDNVVAITFGTQQARNTFGTWTHQTFLYDEFGNFGRLQANWFQGVPLALPSFLFQGQRWDGEIGFWHFKRRVYSSTVGRFLSRDPTGMDGWGGWYGFPGRNPVSRRAPMGLGKREVENGLSMCGALFR